MKKGRILTGKYAKPQNKLSELVRTKAKKAIAQWLVEEAELVEYHANLLSNELLSRAISDRIQKTADSAPDVHLSDNDKINSLVINAKRIANELDEKEELEELLGQLEDRDNNVHLELAD